MARESRRPFQEILQYYGLERFLYRYSCTEHCSPVALNLAFTDSQNTKRQWAGFIRRSNLASAPETLDQIREPLREFLLPVMAAITEGRNFTRTWPAGGPWHAEP